MNKQLKNSISFQVASFDASVKVLGGKTHGRIEMSMLAKLNI